MWNKSNVLLVKIRTRGEGSRRGVRFTIPLSLFALQECLDAWEPLVRLGRSLGIGTGKGREWGWLAGEYLEIGSLFLRELRSYGRLDIVDGQTREGDRIKVALY